MYDKWIKDFIKLPIFAIRRKPIYYRYYDFVKRAFEWDELTFQQWQWENVKRIVEYAYNHVPYYHRIYKNVGFEPGDLKEWKDFEMLPSVSKADIKNNIEEFHSDEFNKIKHRVDYTGGSTSKPMQIFLDDEVYWREDAMYLYYWAKLGFEIGDKCVVLRGAKLIGENNKFKTRYSPTWNYLLFDSSHIGLDLIKEYDDELKKFNAPNIQAYPSSLYLLAKTYKSSGIKPPHFERVFFGSENVYKNQVELIREVFTPNIIVNQYGHTERIVLALQNLDEGGMGFVPFYGYAELLKSDGDGVIREPNIIGEITGTGFTRSMPFIRYRTNDFTSFADKEFERTMVGWKRIQSIEGRLQEFIVTADKRLVSTCSIAGAHIPELSFLYDMQYVQTVPGELIINAMSYPNQEVSDEHIHLIENKLGDFFDGMMKCKINFVDKLERTNRNKKMMLIQKLNIMEYLSDGKG